MRILLVCGQHQYGDPKRGEAYEYTHFLPSLQRLGHEVLHFESFNKSLYIDSVAINRQFLQQVIDFKPDVIFCILMSYEIWLETLRLAKEISGAALVHWSTDDSWKYEEFSQWIAPVFDRYITTYGSAIKKAQGAGWQHFVLSQWATSFQSAKKPLASEECTYDVCFVGMAYGERKKWIQKLSEKGFKVACFGYGWPNGPVTSEKMFEIIRRSRVTLNFSDGSKRWHGFKRITEKQLKARIFEVPGAGGCLLTEHTPDLKNYYNLGQEILSFDSVDHCVSAIHFLLNNPKERDRIAQLGYEKTMSVHTYDQRFTSILFDLKKKPAMIIAHDCWERFAKLEQAHRETSSWEPVLQFFEKFCRVILGEPKGQKVARRIFFEIYWRFAGVKTYAATGLSSKCFFHY